MKGIGVAGECRSGQAGVAMRAKLFPRGLMILVVLLASVLAGCSFYPHRSYAYYDGSDYKHKYSYRYGLPNYDSYRYRAVPRRKPYYGPYYSHGFSYGHRFRPWRGGGYVFPYNRGTFCR